MICSVTCQILLIVPQISMLRPYLDCYSLASPDLLYFLFNLKHPKSISKIPGLIFFAHSVSLAGNTSFQGTYCPSNSWRANHTGASGNDLSKDERTDLLANLYRKVLRYPVTCEIRRTCSPRYHSSNSVSEICFSAVDSKNGAGPTSYHQPNSPLHPHFAFTNPNFSSPPPHQPEPIHNSSYQTQNSQRWYLY